MVPIFCAIMLGVGAIGAFSFKASNQEILRRLDAPPLDSVRTFENTYVGTDGQTWRVMVESEAGESPYSLARRFEAEREAMIQLHPPRR